MTSFDFLVKTQIMRKSIDDFLHISDPYEMTIHLKCVKDCESCLASPIICDRCKSDYYIITSTSSSTCLAGIDFTQKDFVEYDSNNNFIVYMKEPYVEYSPKTITKCIPFKQMSIQIKQSLQTEQFKPGMFSKYDVRVMHSYAFFLNDLASSLGDLTLTMGDQTTNYLGTIRLEFYNDTNMLIDYQNRTLYHTLLQSEVVSSSNLIIIAASLDLELNI